MAELSDSSVRQRRFKKISVEGNIGCGKSTLVKLLQSSCPSWHVVPEPLEKWQNVVGGRSTSMDEGGNLLQMLYSDASRWAYTFQTLSAMGRIRTQLSVPPSAQPVQVFERSIYSDRYVFAASLYEQGNMNDTEWAVYQEWQGWLLSEFDQRVALDGIVYLRAEPETCLARMRVRDRAEERGVGLDYLKLLHKRHENWLVDRTTVVHHPCSNETPVLVLDGNQDFESNAELQAKFVSQVEDFLDKI